MKWRRSSKSTAKQGSPARVGRGSGAPDDKPGHPAQAEDEFAAFGPEDYELDEDAEASEAAEAAEAAGDNGYAEPAAEAAIPCPRATCEGTLDEDRFCDVCGLEAPPPAAVTIPPPGKPPAAARGASSRSTPAKPSPSPSPASTPAATPATPASTPSPSPRPSPQREQEQARSGYHEAVGSDRTGSRPSGSLRSGSQRTGSGITASSGGWTASSSPATTGTRGSGPSGASNRGLLGAGLVEMPHVPYRDPSTVVLQNPSVPEERRFCSRCSGKVGRGTTGRPGRPEGFCAQCGQRFSFTPKLFPGQLVHGQYEVLGCLAHGGLGWIYLARDRAVADRWVVLKGLLDTGDADAMAAALAERHFLAKVEHPNIVKIHNFVQHRDQHGDNVGYIVMEYVGGQSLKDMIKQRRAEIAPTECLPIEQAIAYTIETLRSLGYLHSVGLLFCDFKPDNVIQTQE
ncbi:MAG: serine/threonine protein kinase, partial [Thermocrispum sp.]